MNNSVNETLTRPLILVVDDDLTSRTFAVSIIKSLGYCVLASENGASGLELAHQYLPDVIVTDALMPRLDGREMCRLLKTEPSTSQIKIVITTSLYTKPRYRNEAYKEFLADGYLLKPLDTGVLRVTLDRLLGAHLAVQAI